MGRLTLPGPALLRATMSLWTAYLSGAGTRTYIPTSCRRTAGSGLGQGCTPSSTDSDDRCRRQHADPRRPSPSLQPDVVFGKDNHWRTRWVPTTSPPWRRPRYWRFPGRDRGNQTASQFGDQGTDRIDRSRALRWRRCAAFDRPAGVSFALWHNLDFVPMRGRLLCPGLRAVVDLKLELTPTPI